MNKLAWGILATGMIAKAFAKGVNGSRTGKLMAVGSRSKEKAEQFGNEFQIPRRYGSYEALLADKDVQAVYIATPHPMHAEWAIKAARAKKHLLVEKPIGMNFAEAMAIVEAARDNDVFLMEAFMYRCHPQTHKLVELIREKAIGEVRVIQATFSFYWPKPFHADSRLTNHELGGGGIADVGTYPTTLARLIAGVAAGKPFAEPTEVKAIGCLTPSRVDSHSVAVLKFPGEIIAQVATGVQVNQENVVRIFGTDGQVFVPDPWTPSRDPGTTKIIVHRDGKPPQEIPITTDRGLYAIEADTVAECLDRRQASSPAMSWDDTLGNMKVLDRWRQEMGLTYDFEKPENLRPIPPRTLSVRPKHTMKYGRLPHLDKPVARLAMGADFSGHFPREFNVIADEYFERGGNMFDTAFVYGRADLHLGTWIRTRGVRDKIILLAKGAVTPHCNPKDFREQFFKSLENLQTDFVDLYLFHRDNLELPVGELVEAVNEQIKAGRIKAWGGSNWTTQRVQAANEYAKAKGLQGLSAVSNNLSLARMVDPVWEGCIAASDPESRSWHTRTQVAMIPWSSQARGFFTERGDPSNTSDEEMSRCWQSEDNFERRRRAYELAEQKNVLPINIALAYVLCQPFPTFPLIGPRQLSELRTSLPALDVGLTAAELKWLNLET